MKVAIVVGTRPEIIKMSPIIKYCSGQRINYDVIHTQQHYSDNMDRIFFEKLNIDYPKLSLGVNPGEPHLQISSIIERCGEVFKSNNYDIVLVQGDTNTVLGAAISAQKCGVKIGHVEAGLRSFDKSMPEEINRILTDQISDFCFCPTDISKNNLMHEGIDENKIYVVGNTIVDVIKNNIGKAKNLRDIQNTILTNKYALVTLHRPANVDVVKSLSTIINVLKKIQDKLNYQIIFPVHPRTYNRIVAAGIDIGHICIVDPVNYFSFLSLMIGSSIIITDSGGIQEEACILNKPCITVRENTERPETISIGANILTGLNEVKIFGAIESWSRKSVTWNHPFGNGNSGEMIMKIILKTLK